MLERHHLSIIREVQRAGGVTAASKRLNLSQSAVSHSVAKLEDIFGVKVWEKTGRRLRFTQAGAYLVALAERLLPEFEQAESMLSDFSKGKRGTLRMGMECHPCEKWLMRVTGPYLTEWPDINLEILTAFRFDGVSALQSNEIDLLITPDPVDLPDLRFQPVFDYELVIVAHHQSSLARQTAPVVPKDLQDEVLFTVPVDAVRLDIFTQFLVPAGCRPRRWQGIESIELSLQLVAAGRGVTVLPKWLVQEMGGGMPISTRQIGEAGLHKSIHLGTRAGEEDVDYLGAFIESATTHNGSD
ncbi:MAG: LysR family transcriptional regulator [Pseudomonadota bacterium]